jgi:hypothetical protein
MISGTRRTTVYNLNGLITETYYSRDVVSSQWIPGTRQEYVLESHGHAILNAYYWWDPVTAGWKGSSKNETQYDAEGNPVGFHFYTWDENTSAFVDYLITELSRNVNGQVIEQIDHIWDTQANDWILRTKVVQEYSDAGNQTLLAFYQWNTTSSQWIDSTKTTWYYSEHTFTPVKEVNDALLRVYPNPASGYVVFDMGEVSSPVALEMFDSQGRRVLEHMVAGQEPVQVGKLARGVYMYRLTVNGKTYRGKILLK